MPKIHKEVTVLKDENLLGNNQLKLTNCKGGKVRVIELPPELYQKVNEIVQREGVFSFLYRTYMSDLKTAALETNQQFQGSHGLRWCYSQRAFKEAQENGASYEDALKQVSTSLGHCRKTITLHYLK